MEEKNIRKNIQSENRCYESDDLCCDIPHFDSTNNETKTTVNIDEIQKGSNKLYIDIYVPMDACACEWSQFMNLIFSILTPYIKYIKHDTKNLNSDEARKLNLYNKCVVVDNKKKYTTSYALKKDLPKLLKEKGLIK